MVNKADDKTYKCTDPQPARSINNISPGDIGASQANSANTLVVISFKKTKLGAILVMDKADTSYSVFVLNYSYSVFNKLYSVSKGVIPSTR